MAFCQNKKKMYLCIAERANLTHETMEHIEKDLKTSYNESSEDFDDYLIDDHDTRMIPDSVKIPPKNLVLRLLWRIFRRQIEMLNTIFVD